MLRIICEDDGCGEASLGSGDAGGQRGGGGGVCSDHYRLDEPQTNTTIKLIMFIALHCANNPIYLFPEKELHGLSPDSYIRVSESDLYIPRIGPHIWLHQIRQTDPGYILISSRYMSLGIGREYFNSVLEIRRLHSFIT